MNKLAILTVSVALTIGAIACKKESPVKYDCTGVTPTYEANIKTIMNNSCATSGCHSASSKRDGIDLSTYALVKSEAAKDKFLGSIEHLSGYEAMPQGGSKLSDDNIKLISCWIDNGMPEK